MNLRLTLLAVALCGGSGCSLIYNPNNLPEPATDGKLPPDAPDAQIILDADPSALELTRVTPAVLVEGTGTGGGRAVVVVIEGRQIVPGAKVEIGPHGGLGVAKILVDNDKVDVSADGNMIAVPVVVEVDPALGANDSVRLDVTVRQPGGEGEVVRTLAGGPNDEPILSLQGLDELDDEDPEPRQLAAGVHEFSTVNITTGGLAAAANQAAPIIVRARGSITIGGTTSVSAAGRTPGPTGGIGGVHGNGSALMATPGTAGAGPSNGSPS
ncbi:MAG: hypothetical protein KIT31_34680, partial [Deltaproteobacteria bacterium]|nr:hypothetical protein [Deltaproteobacteria bacterium]